MADSHSRGQVAEVGRNSVLKCPFHTSPCSLDDYRSSHQDSARNFLRGQIRTLFMEHISRGSFVFNLTTEYSMIIGSINPVTSFRPPIRPREEFSSIDSDEC
jgi:hypothetical protein